jgi:nucleoside-diphosphate-sugar epimerase
MKIIIGNTGLVGTTLCESIDFELKFNSSNLSDFLNIVEDGSELYLTCLPATKWMVNKNVTGDFENLLNILNVIKQKKYSKVILISTIDVYNNSPLKSNETNSPSIQSLNYGNNRYLFEVLCKDYLITNEFRIFRLPALFNKHIKKNVLFDLINNNNVEQINFNSMFQWYNLDNLSNDISTCIKEHPKETIFNLFPEPIDSLDILNFFPYLRNKINFSENKIVYDFTTKFSNNGYISTKEDILTEIKEFINETFIK